MAHGAREGMNHVMQQRKVVLVAPHEYEILNKPAVWLSRLDLVRRRERRAANPGARTIVDPLVFNVSIKPRSGIREMRKLAGLAVAYERHVSRNKSQYLGAKSTVRWIASLTHVLD